MNLLFSPTADATAEQTGYFWLNFNIFSQSQ